MAGTTGFAHCFYGRQHESDNYIRGMRTMLENLAASVAENHATFREWVNRYNEKPGRSLVERLSRNYAPFRYWSR